MKKTIFSVVVLFACTVLFSNILKAQADPNFGIWQAFGDNNSYHSQVRGRLLSLYWKDIQTGINTWDWNSTANSFDNVVIKKTKSANGISTAGSLPVIISIFVYSDEGGISAPQWLYAPPLNIPKVVMKNSDAPYFYCKPYQDQYKIMVDSIHNHIAAVLSDPNANVNLKKAFQKIIGLQACFGSTGDFISYKETATDTAIYPTVTCTLQREPGNTSTIATPFDETEYNELFHIFAKMYQDAYYTNGVPSLNGIRILHNPGNEGDAQDQWLQANCAGTWRKAGSIGHLFQVNYETARLGWWENTLSDRNNPGATDEYIRGRSEIVGGIEDMKWWNGLYVSNPDCSFTQVTRGAATFTGYQKKNLFTLYASMLNYGVDWANPTSTMLTDTGTSGMYSNNDALLFYNKYAGQKRAAASTAKAFCMLRDGLNAADTFRFPPTGTYAYGSYTYSNPNDPNEQNLRAQRAYNVLTISTARNGQPKARGGLLEDPCAAINGEFDNRRAMGINDVGYGIDSGNYGRFITQIKPKLNLDGVGDAEVVELYESCNNYYNQNYPNDDGSVSMFGRFAKAVRDVWYKKAMYFNIEDSFVLNYNGNLKFTIWYLDKGTLNNSWLLKHRKYNDSGDTTETSVAKTGSNTWKKQEFTISANCFKNHFSVNNADFALFTQNTGGSSGEIDIFSLIEIEKVPVGGLAPKSVVVKETVADNIAVSPNPVTGRFTVATKDKKLMSSVTISNQMGRVVYQKKVSGNTINLQRTELGNNPGIYFISVTVDGNVYKAQLRVL